MMNHIRDKTVMRLVTVGQQLNSNILVGWRAIKRGLVADGLKTARKE
jgi:hypothetical protein